MWDVSPEMLSDMMSKIMAGMRPPSKDPETTNWPRSGGKGGGLGVREFLLCKVNQGVVKGRKEGPYFMVFVVIFLVKGVDSFDKVVNACGLSDSLEDVWGIL